MASILSIHTPALFDAAVAEASARLQRGELVALPTETVYGLAANALDPKAVARIYEVKGRPSRNPIIVHVATAAMARQCANTWTPTAARLAAAFWPGPLTLVVERSRIIPDIVTAGGGTVGLRWPAHPFTQAVIRASGLPVAAPSANRSNELSPTTAQHVATSLGNSVSLIIDGGQSQVGIESTVVDVTRDRIRLLRPGMIQLDAILAAAGEDDRSVTFFDAAVGPGPEAPGPLPSPGLLERHYSPRARLVILRWKNDDDLRRQLDNLNLGQKDCHLVVHTRLPSVSDSFASVRLIPHDAEAYARAIYAELHRCDELGARVIVAEAVPETPEWDGIADRLQRASYR